MEGFEVSPRVLKRMGFQLEYEFLGKGTFGGVVRVEDEEGNSYALKMQKASEFNDREWETSQKIRSAKCPYLIEHIQLEKDREYVYLQLEYANFRNLQELLVKKKFGMHVFTLHLMWQILTGVSVLHTNGIIHRDLKGENILCHKNPNNEITIKISDFGLARIVSEGNPGVTQCGTPVHMAPEILAGIAYGAQADVWSLGVLFFVMADNNEAHPFPAHTFSELVEMINRPIQRPMHLFPSPAADAWWDVICAMLCIKKRDRPTVFDVLAMPLFAKYRSEADFSSSSSSSFSSEPSEQVSQPPKVFSKTGPPTPPPVLVESPIVRTFPPCTNYYLQSKKSDSTVAYK